MLGICNLSIVPVRIVDSDKSEMINQLIYGDIIEILEEKEKWVKIKSVFDDYIGWIDKNCLLYTSPSPRDGLLSRMPSSA